MFTVTTDRERGPDGVVVKMTGAATMEAAPQLSMALMRVVAGHPRWVVLDFSDLQLLTSICIGELVAFRNGVLRGRGGGEAGGVVVVAGATEFVNRSLTFSRLDTVFPLYPSVDAAIASVKGEGARVEREPLG